MTRTCKSCALDLPIEQFERYNNGTSEGWRWKCRQCLAPARRAACRRYYRSDPKREAERRKERRAYQKAWYEANRERMVAAACQWRLDNLERARENEQRYRDRHPEQRRAQKKARREGTGPLERDYMRVLLVDPCSYCGGETDSIDHIDPIAASGGNEWSNLTAACRSCNSSKNDKPLLFALASDHTHLGLRRL